MFIDERPGGHALAGTDLLETSAVLIVDSGLECWYIGVVNSPFLCTEANSYALCKKTTAGELIHSATIGHGCPQS